MKFIKQFFELFYTRQVRFENWLAFIRWALIGLVFVTPLFFVGGLSYPMEFSKVVLFDVVVLLGAVLLILGMVLTREVSWLAGKLWWPLGGFAFFYLLSFFFSRDYYMSAVGVSGYYSGGLVTIFCLFIFFYMIIQVIRSWRDARWLLGSALTSLTLVTVYNLFHIHGLNILPWSLTEQLRFYIASSSSVALAIVVAVMTLLSGGWLATTKALWQRLAAGLLALAGLTLLYFLDKNSLWYALLISSAVLLIIYIIKWHWPPRWSIVIPIVFIGVAMLGLFTDGQLLTSAQVSESILLDQSTSASIAWSSARKRPITGSGPQTFVYDFHRYEPRSFNQTAGWNNSFIKAGNEWWGRLAGIGFVGMLGWLVFIIWIIARSARSVLVGASHTQRSAYVWLWASWILLTVAGLVVPFTFTVSLLWWLLTALLVRMSYSFFSIRKKRLEQSHWCTALTSAALVLGIAFTTVVIVFGIRFWLADVYYQRAQTKINNQEDIATIADILQQAIQLNPHEVDYYVALAQGQATAAQLTALEKSADQTVLQREVQAALDAIRDAKNRFPDNLAVYQQEGLLYDSLRNLVSNVDELSVVAYETATRLAPVNPLFRLNLGRSRLLWGEQLFQQDDADQQAEGKRLVHQALTDFDEAYALKKDFTIALVNKGLAYEVLGDIDAALGLYQQVVDQAPEAVDVQWRMALLFEQQGNLNQAVSLLQQILTIDPENSTVANKLKTLQAAREGE